MIRVSISYGFGEDNRYNLDNIPENIQWSLFKYEKFSEENLAYLELNNINVNVVHLPIDILRRPQHEIMELMNKIHETVGTEKFVIHPNKLITSFIHYYINDHVGGRTLPKYKLCIENFQWRKKKELRSPLEILKYCIKYPQYFGFCLDTSHAEEIWLDHKILYTLLPYTEVIHLSNRNYSERKQHMPFNTGKGDLNLMAFVNHLKFIKWNGDLVLEYMPEYTDKKIKNYHFLKEHLNG